MSVNLHISMTPFQNETRLMKEARSLLADGIADRVDVVALADGPRDEAGEIAPNFGYRRLALRSRKLPKSLLFQLIKYLEFAWRTVWFCRGRDVTIVNCHALASLPIGVAIKWLFGAKLVYDAHELETEKNGLVGARQRLSRILERGLIGQADLTIVVGDAIADWYANAYPITRPTVVMNCPYLRSMERSDVLRQELGLRADQRIFLYQGVMSAGRGIEPLVDAFQTLSSDRDVLVVMGYGELEQLVVDAAARSRNVRYRPAVSPDVLHRYTASADVGLSLVEPVCLSYAFALPNKFFEYVMAELPSLSLPSLTEQASILSAHGLGVVVPDLDARTIVSTVEGIGDLSRFKPALREARRIYCWENQETRMLDAYRAMFRG